MTELEAKGGPRQDRIALLLSSGGPATPASVKRTATQPRRAWRSRDQRITRPRLTWGLAGAAAAGVTAVVVGSSGAGGAQELSASRVAYVWKLQATSHSVAPDPTNRSQLAVSFHGTPYPNYRDHEGWHAVGTRSERLAGHAAFTVFYATGARRSAYTVVAGTRVSVPADARWTVVNGLRLTEFRSGDEWIIVFANHGNSCVLTAAAPRERAWLLKVAVWESALNA